MIKTQGDRNLVANGLGVLSAFMVGILLVEAGVSYYLAPLLAVFISPVIPVLYALKIASKNHQTLPQYLSSPQASRVTKSLIILVLLTLFSLACFAIAISVLEVVQNLRARFSLPDSALDLAVLWTIGVIAMILSLWPTGRVRSWLFPSKAQAEAKTEPSKDKLAMRILGLILIGLTTSLLLGHMLVEYLLGQPFKVVELTKGWSRGIHLFVSIVILNLLKALSDAIAHRIRARHDVELG